MKKLFHINDDFINSRLDRWFKKNVFDVPQSLIEKNIRNGNIKINNKKKKSSYKLKKDDQVIIYNYSFSSTKNKKSINKYITNRKELRSFSDIFIENNENFAVINKPAGISVQYGTKSRRNIIDIIRNTKEFENVIPHTVHRIDKETTGILIIAKNRKYAQLFTSLFRIRKIHKIYLGIAVGEFERKKGTFVDELLHYEGQRKIWTKAITHFNVLDSNNNYTFLKLSPETGRKHQLRKQLLMHGYPILGDSKYRVSKNKHDKIRSLMLHAYKINFSIEGTRYNYLAELPITFKKTLKEKYLRIS